MGGRALEQALPDKGLAEEQLDVLLGPSLGGQGLQKHHDLLKVHLDQLVGPLHQEGGADVEMKLGEALFFGLVEKRDVLAATYGIRGWRQWGKPYQISVPHSDSILDADLAHEQTVHPPKTKLDEFHAFVLEMFRQVGVDPRC